MDRTKTATRQAFAHDLKPADRCLTSQGAGVLTGIEKELTFLAARHTFATTVTLSNGIPIETVSAMLGHKNFRKTQIYAKVVKEKIISKMRTLREKLT